MKEYQVQLEDAINTGINNTYCTTDTTGIVLVECLATPKRTNV